MTDKALAILAAIGIGGYVFWKKAAGSINIPQPANPIAGVVTTGTLGSQAGATGSTSGSAGVTAAGSAGGLISGLLGGIASGIGSVVKGTNTTGPGNDTINGLAGDGSVILDPGAVDLGLNDPLAGATGNYNNSIGLSGDPTNGMGILGGPPSTVDDPLGVGTLSLS